MKILVVASKFEPEYTGPGVRIIRLYEDLSCRYNIDKPDVICGSKDYMKSDQYIWKGHNVNRIVFDFSRTSHLPKLIKKIISDFYVVVMTLRILNKHYNDVDIVHVLGSSALTRTAVHWTRKRKKGLLLELVNKNARVPRKLFPLMPLDLSRGTVIVAISDGLRRICFEDGFIYNVWHRPNPVNIGRFTFREKIDKKIISEELGFPFDHDDIIILNIASFIPRKNQVLLVKTLKQLPIKYKLILAGPLTNLNESKPYLEKVKNLIKKLQLDDRICLIPEFVDTARYLQYADIYALPSYKEGLGNPMLEAIMCAKPIVANEDEQAFQEWIKIGCNGILAKGNARSFADAIKYAVKIPHENLKRSATLVQNIVDANKIHTNYFKLLSAIKDNGCSRINVDEVFRIR